MSNTLGCLCDCVVYFSLLHPPQGKNVTGEEFDALQSSFGDVSWEMACDEYKNDLAQPAFLAAPPAAQPPAQPEPPATDPEAPASDHQWKKIDQSVA